MPTAKKKNHYVREVFNPKLPLFVKKSFKGAGRSFLPGQRFDWKRLSMNQRRVMLMFEQRYLTHEDPEFTVEDEEADKKINTENKGDLQTDDDGADDEGTENKTQDPETQAKETGLKAVSRGKGWFDVHDASGKVLNQKPIRKAVAEKWAADGLDPANK